MNHLLFVSFIPSKPTVTIQIEMKNLNENEIGQTICVDVSSQNHKNHKINKK